MELRNLHQSFPHLCGIVEQLGRDVDGQRGVFRPVVIEILRCDERIMFWPQITNNPFYQFFYGLCLIGGRCEILERYWPGSETDFNKLPRPVYSFLQDGNGGLIMNVFHHTAHVTDASFTGATMVFEYTAKKLGMKMRHAQRIFGYLHAEVSQRPFIKGFGKAARPVMNERDPYAKGMVEPFPMVEDPAVFESDLKEFLNGNTAMGFKSRFFRRVVLPLENAHRFYREHGDQGEARYTGALDQLGACEAKDWKFAGDQWLVARLEQWKEEKAKEE